MHQEALIVVEIGHDDFQEIVGLAGDHVTGDDFGKSHDGLLERGRPIVGMTFDLHADEDAETQANALAPQHRAIGFDVALALQAIDPSQAGRGRQSDTLGQLDIAQAAVGLKSRYDAIIYRVQVLFWHLCS